MQSERRRSMHHGLRVAGVIVGLGAMLALSPCRMVSDTVTGVDLASGTLSKRSGCHKACDSQYRQLVRDEERRHKSALRACGSHDRACRKAEQRLHKSNLEALEKDRRKCKRGCYNEGGGRGGL